MKALSDFSVFALQNTLLRTHPIISSGKLIKIEWSTYIKNAGTVKHKTTSYNNTYKSANYDNAAVKAITSLNPWSDDGIGIKIGSKWFYFS